MSLGLWGFFWSSQANLSVPEANDGLAATTAVLVQANASVSEANDTIVASSSILVQANASLTEAGDTLTASSAIIVGAVLSVVEANDALSATASIIVGLSGAITEASDAVSSASGVLVTSALVITESDALSAAVNTGGGVNADLSVIEGNDALSAAATVPEIRFGGGFDTAEIHKAASHYRQRTARKLSLRLKESGDRLTASASVDPIEMEDDEEILMLLAA